MEDAGLLLAAGEGETAGACGCFATGSGDFAGDLPCEIVMPLKKKPKSTIKTIKYPISLN